MTPDQLLTGLRLLAWVLLLLSVGAAAGQLIMAIPRLLQGVAELIATARKEGFWATLEMVLAAPFKGLWQLARFALLLLLIVFLLAFLLPEKMAQFLDFLPRAE